MLYIVYNNAIVTVHSRTCFILADFRSPPLLLAGLNSTASIFTGWIFFLLVNKKTSPFWLVLFFIPTGASSYWLKPLTWRGCYWTSRIAPPSVRRPFSKKRGEMKHVILKTRITTIALPFYFATSVVRYLHWHQLERWRQGCCGPHAEAWGFLLRHRAARTASHIFQRWKTPTTDGAA